jgi:acetylornithine deacetylase/succinyl-diaminopimelate desuccinylase-like protein
VDTPLAAPWLDELSELLRIPSISADPAHRDDVLAAGAWVRDFIRRAGGEAEIVDWHGQPLVLGELRASTGADAAPTVLAYGHFDVQPPAPLDLWESPPFEPTVREGMLVARGVADDKGQLYMLLRAAADLAAEGLLPVNVRFACDGEEEVGGHSIVDYLGQDERGADAAVIFDSGMIAEGVWAFDVATRGLVYFHVELESGDRDLHSGLYGGAALNGIHALMQALSAVTAGPDGLLPEPLRAGLVPPTAGELADWAAMPSGAGELAAQGASPADATAADEFYRRTWAEPAVDVNGIDGGSPHLQKTVLPVRAVANVSIRLAPGQKVEPVAEAFERLLREAAPAGARLAVERLSDSPPGLVDPAAPAISLALDAFEGALGSRPLLVRSGGTLPIVPALADRGIPTVITGFSLPDANIHSPNEQLRIDYVPQGIAAARALYLAWGALA